MRKRKLRLGIPVEPVAAVRDGIIDPYAAKLGKVEPAIPIARAYDPFEDR